MFRILTCWAALCIGLCTATFGDDEAPTSGVKDAALTPSRLDEVLEKWRMAFADVHSCRAEFNSYEYDRVFLVEKRGQGELHFQFPDRLRWTIEPVELNDNDAANPRKVSIWNEQYHLVSASHTTWYLDHNTLMMFNHEDETYDWFQMPRHLWASSPTPLDPLREESPETAYLRERGFADNDMGVLPSLFVRLGIGMQLCDQVHRMGSLLCGREIAVFQQEFIWKLDRDTEKEIRLAGKPRTLEASQSVSHVDVILDVEAYRPKAVRFIDPAGTKETVYVISVLRINDFSQPVVPPNVRDYKPLQLVSHVNPAADQPSVQADPDNAWLSLYWRCVVALLIL